MKKNNAAVITFVTYWARPVFTQEPLHKIVHRYLNWCKTLEYMYLIL